MRELFSNSGGCTVIIKDTFIKGKGFVKDIASSDHEVGVLLMVSLLDTGKI